jgi:hypothetical protein
MPAKLGAHELVLLHGQFGDGSRHGKLVHADRHAADQPWGNQQ